MVSNLLHIYDINYYISEEYDILQNFQYDVIKIVTIDFICRGFTV